MEKRPQTTWDEVLAERGVDLNAARRQGKIEKLTCVIRALSNIVGAAPPEELIDLRLAQIEKAPTPEDLIAQAQNLGVEIESQITHLRAQDEQYIFDLLTAARSGETDFAKKLADLEPEWQSIKVSDLRNLVAEGVPVMFVGSISSGNCIGDHAMHINFNPKTGKMISLSDEGIEFTVIDDQIVRVLVFNKKND